MSGLSCLRNWKKRTKRKISVPFDGLELTNPSLCSLLFFAANLWNGSIWLFWKQTCCNKLTEHVLHFRRWQQGGASELVWQVPSNMNEEQQKWLWDAVSLFLCSALNHFWTWMITMAMQLKNTHQRTSSISLIATWQKLFEAAVRILSLWTWVHSFQLRQKGQGACNGE